MQRQSHIVVHSDVSGEISDSPDKDYFLAEKHENLERQYHGEEKVKYVHNKINVF